MSVLHKGPAHTML